MTTRSTFSKRLRTADSISAASRTTSSRYPTTLGRRSRRPRSARLSLEGRVHRGKRHPGRAGRAARRVPVQRQEDGRAPAHAGRPPQHQDKDFQEVSATAGANLKQLMIDAAKGTVPADIQDEDEKKKYKGHSQRWFKNEDGGRELLAKVFSLGLWPALKAELLPFCNAVRKAVELDAVADVKP